VTPSGIEEGRNVAGTHGKTGVSTERNAKRWPAATSGCSECNEALDTARDAMAVARLLAIVAENALLNGDLQRARSALRDLREATTGDDSRRAANASIGG